MHHILTQLTIIFKGKYRDLSDSELLEKYRSASDPELIGILFSRYSHLVYGVCLKYLSNREESKDAVMQIFEKLITEIPNHNIQNFKSWVYVLTKNYCLMQIRSGKARDKREEIWSRNFMESEDELHPIDREDKDLNGVLMECIGKLKNEQKQCIDLFYFKNKCYQEIAGELNLDEKKVKSYLQNGKRNLKLCLESKHVKE